MNKIRTLSFEFGGHHEALGKAKSIHTAQTICSNVFISGRDAEDVFKEDIAPLHFLFAIKNLVLVRFGATSIKSAWNDDAFVASILAALP